MTEPTSPAFSADNPFFSASTLPFQAPAFDRIQDSDYQPAIEEGMRRHLAEVAGVAERSDAPTFENTLVALEQSGRMLTRVLKVFGGIASANTNDTLQEIQVVVSPLLAAHSDAIYLNERLFARVKTIYERRAELGLTSEQRMLVERYHIDFVRAGARLSDDDKTRLRALNQEESKLATEFQNRLLAAVKAGAVVVDTLEELDGLSEGDIARAEEAARERGLVGKWVLLLHNTTQQPVQATLRNRSTRRRLFEASIHRADGGGAVDTRALVLRISELRAERAQLLGYANWASFILDDQMARKPDAALELLSSIAGVATAKARGEIARIQALMQSEDASLTLEPWDWQYYAEQVRKAEYAIDETQIKPYFELERVLHDGVFFAATKLFGITFSARADLPVYHPDVRVYEVFDEDGTSLALIYCDLFKRENKLGGAWMDSFVDQSALLGTKPVVVNVANFAPPAAGLPALLGVDDVTTMFHEFGHALHGMLSRVEYPLLTGTSVPRDFVEFPSQFNEHWALDPAVFANYAKHYETGEPMPESLVEKIKKTQTFNQGFALTEYIAAAFLDMAWHTRTPASPALEVAPFEHDALTRFHADVREVPPRYRSTYFAHIWSGGYSAGYYAYLWAEVLDHDAFAWFRENGGLTRENGRRYRDMILARGGTDDAAALFRAFRGRDPEVGPLLVKRGLITAPGGT